VLVLAAALICGGPAQAAQAVDKYGEFIVLNALLWLPAYLENVDPELFRAAETLVQGQIEEDLGRGELLTLNHRWKAGSIVRFLPQASGVFDLPGAPAPRFAVTGDALDSPIIFNLDRISRPDSFGFEQAVRLWIHELGHKVNLDKTKSDQIAAEVGRRFGWQGTFENGLLLLNGTPFQTAALTPVSPVEKYFQIRTPNRVAVIHGNRLLDITVPLNAGIDSTIPPHKNYVEFTRIVTKSKKLGENHFSAEVRAFRQPRRQNQYALTDTSIGGSVRYHLEFRVQVLGGEPRVEVLRYEQARKILNVVPDAGLEILSLHREGRGISGRLAIKVTTENYHHGASYPVHRRAALLLKSGDRDIEVPLEIHADLRDRGWGSMPGEIHRTETVKHGNFTGELPADWPRDFEVTGMVDEFFGMGAYTTYAPIPMILTMDKPFKTGCEDDLLPVRAD